MSAIADEPLGIVIVDDDPIFRDLICSSVARRSKFVLHEAGSGDELLAVMSRERIDCIVLDYDLGTETGFTVKQRVDEVHPERVPAIMMTGDGRESTAVRAFRIGVSDYLPKRDLRPEALVASVRAVVERNREELRLKEEHRRLMAAATVDPMTGLESRARLDERLAVLAGLTAQARAGFALVLIELVQHRSIVQRFGFRTADQAVRLAAKRLQELTRGNDVATRFAEDTFLVIADLGGDAALLRGLCQRLSDKLALRLTTDQGDMDLVVRVGGAFAPRQIERPEDLTGPALKALADAVGGATEGSLAPESRAASAPAAAAATAGEPLRTTDRRGEPRQRVFKRGLIHSIDTRSTINCTVRNLSARGAGLRLEAPCPVPETFDFEIIGSGTLRRVRVCWHVGRDLGVEYVGGAGA